MKNNYHNDSMLIHLNEEQRKVVQCVDGPLLVLAGAGSGKTRSVIFRVAWMIKQKNIKPWNILVVTFTNKAARELKDRLIDLIGDTSQSVWIGTFHSICLRILRYEHHSLVNYNSDFSVYDRDDQLSVLKKVYHSENIDKSVYPINKILSIISKYKSQMINPDNFFDFNNESKINILFHKIYLAYSNYLKQNNAMDFDDILLNTAQLLEENKSIRDKYRAQLQYIMIDEYQDTNLVQFNIIHNLAKIHQNLCVVGDDDQSIYGWRGANVQNILCFEKDYNKVQVIKLEQNYRSPMPVLELANSIIKNNKNRHTKSLWTNIESNDLPKLISHDNEYEEARYISEEITDLISKGSSINECVVLYRTNAQSRVLEQSFTKNQIPYTVVGGINFYQRAEVKDMIAWLRIISNPSDNESLLRIINTPPRNIGKTTISKLIEIAIEHQQSIFKVISNQEFIKHLPKKTLASITDLAQNLSKWQKNINTVNLLELIKEIISIYELEQYYQNTDEGKENTKVENIHEFISSATEFIEQSYQNNKDQAGVSEFLQFLSLQTDLDLSDHRNQQEAVRLMTMHNAKGLEFDNVFIAGLEQGLLPHTFSQNNEDEIEEERRLFYVAVTRAKKKLFLNYAHTRRMGESYQASRPSQFLGEIKHGLLEEIKASFWEFHAPQKQNYKPKIDNETKIITESQKFFKIGQKITHQEFGSGVILNVDGLGRDAKLTISFNSGSMKKIIGTWVEIANEKNDENY